MGIPKFFSAIGKTIGTDLIASEGLPSEIDSLSLDLASLAHQAAGKSYGYDKNTTDNELHMIQQKSAEALEKDFHNNLTDSIMQITTAVKPNRILFIALDGVPVAAKIPQQRARRFLAVQNRNSEIPFDTNNLTAGTDFMQRLNVHIEQWIRDNRDRLPIIVLYSSHLDPGEGEHKIMEAYRNTDYFDSNGKHVIHGLDADLFMLSLLAPLEKLYLWRQGAVGFSPEVIDIYKSRKGIIKYMSSDEHKATVNDFVVVTSLLGNDFIPRHPALEDFNHSLPILLDIYKTLGLDIMRKGRIRWRNMFKFLEALSDREAELLIHMINVKVLVPSSVLKSAYNRPTATFDYEKFKEEWYNRIFTIETGKGGMNISSVRRMESSMVERYIEMMNFVYRYYSRGSYAVNSYFYYDYHYAPLFSDILEVGLENIESIMDESIWTKKSQNDDNKGFLHPLHLLVNVLPLASSSLYPKSMRTQVNKEIKDDDLWSTAFPRSKIERDLEGHTVDHIAPVIIPFLNPYTVEEIKLPQKEGDSLSEEPLQIFKRKKVKVTEIVVNKYDGLLF